MKQPDAPGDRDNLLDHDYDGIQELDNSLPRWWLMAFYLTIVFAVGYFVWYQVGNGTSLLDRLQADLDNQQNKALKTARALQMDPNKLAAYLKDPARLSTGKKAYATRCVSCHADRGQGGIGPNLTDDYWLNGDGKPVAVATIIRDGVPAKGMPTWGSLLDEDEIYALAAFVKTLRGTNPAGAKAPQGSLQKE